MQFASVDNTLEAIKSYCSAELPNYETALRSAFSSHDAVFARKRYADFFWHCATTVPGWLPQVVLANATAEAEGSAKLLRLWRGVDYNDTVERKVLAHAKDESRHSRVFLRLAEAAFPRSLEVGVRAGLNQRLPDIRHKQHTKYAARIREDMLIDHLVQMNLGEIRTRIHMHLLGPVICAFTPAESRPEVERRVTGLERDEVRHIAYTAQLMEEWAQSGDRARIARLYERRLVDLSELTVQQTERAVRQFGQGLFPDLLEI